MPSRRGTCEIGTSGYQYDHWRKEFYPESLSKKEWLSFYAEHFHSVEINNTFYNLPDAKTFDHWHDTVGDEFCFALKFSRYGTHLKHLKDPEQSIEIFVERAGHLGRTLGPILVQLPPRWSPDIERLDDFLDAAPRRLRWAVELRDERWLVDDVYEVLRKHGAALCIHDMIEDHPREITADWTYLRFHGDHYAGNYSSQQLTAEARRIEGYLTEGLDVYAYFNNDAKGNAVHNAADLKRYVENASA